MPDPSEVPAYPPGSPLLKVWCRSCGSSFRRNPLDVPDGRVGLCPGCTPGADTVTPKPAPGKHRKAKHKKRT